MPILFTPHLDLLPATVDLLKAELEGPAALANALDLSVPPNWPPELYDADAINYSLNWLLAHPAESDWGFYYIAERAMLGGTLVGAGGFKGSPGEDGTVEIGYSIVTNYQRRGYATEAVRTWLEFAFGFPQVKTVIGQTLPSLPASIKVLEKTGFRFMGSGHDPHAPADSEVVRYEITRASFIEHNNAPFEKAGSLHADAVPTSEQFENEAAGRRDRIRQIEAKALRKLRER